MSDTAPTSGRGHFDWAAPASTANQSESPLSAEDTIVDLVGEDLEDVVQRALREREADPALHAYDVSTAEPPDDGPGGFPVEKFLVEAVRNPPTSGAIARDDGSCSSPPELHLPNPFLGSFLQSLRVEESPPGSIASHSEPDSPPALRPEMKLEISRSPGRRSPSRTPTSQRSPSRTARRPRKTKVYKEPTPSSFCHICQRTKSLVACTNIVRGMCRKSICRVCFETYDLGMDFATAREIAENVCAAAGVWLGDRTVSESSGRERAGGEGQDGGMRREWLCTHCRAACPQQARCLVYDRATERRRQRIQDRRLGLGV